MMEEKFVDPRLQKKELVFQQLHLATFDTMSNAQAVIQQVKTSGTDIDQEDENFQQLLRDFEVTRNMTDLKDSPLLSLCQSLEKLIKNKTLANATIAQACAAATNTLNHWRILGEIPVDLREVEEVSGTLKQNYFEHKQAWENLLQA